MWCIVYAPSRSNILRTEYKDDNHIAYQTVVLIADILTHFMNGILCLQIYRYT